VTREALVARRGVRRRTTTVPAANAVVVRQAANRVLTALDNDLNTSVALSVVGELAKVGNDLVMQVPKQKKDPAAQAVSRALAAATVEALDACCAPLGLMQVDGERVLRAHARPAAEAPRASTRRSSRPR
jgi:cysteinyl-tRNA synthetase